MIFSDVNNELYKRRNEYSKLSKIYYIYKNYKPLPKYIGFVHYRTFFAFENIPPDMNKIFETHDAILYKISVLKTSLYERFISGCLKSMFDDCIQIVKENFSEYYETTKKVVNDKKVIYKNSFIMKKEDFIKYCHFIFGVFMEYDRRHNINTDEDMRNYLSIELPKWLGHNNFNIKISNRNLAYLGEYFSTAFFFHHFKKHLYVN